MIVRDATGDDLIAITAIYNDAVMNTTAIWNETPVDVANRADWLTMRRNAGYPVLVAVSAAGDVGGYASFGDWRAFEGYRFTVEHSVYVATDARGLGIGRLLMQALIGRAAALGKHVMVAGIEDGNKASVSLHESLGFVTTGILPEVGTKFGRWLDLRFMQLTLPVAENAAAPVEPVLPAS